VVTQGLPKPEGTRESPPAVLGVWPGTALAAGSEHQILR